MITYIYYIEIERIYLHFLPLMSIKDAFMSFTGRFVKPLHSASLSNLSKLLQVYY